MIINYTHYFIRWQLSVYFYSAACCRSHENFSGFKFKLSIRTRKKDDFRISETARLPIQPSLRFTEKDGPTNHLGFSGWKCYDSNSNNHSLQVCRGASLNAQQCRTLKQVTRALLLTSSIPVWLSLLVFPQDNAPRHKAQITSNNWFLEHDNELPVIWTRLQTEQEIHIMDVQITNLCDAFMSIRTHERFQLIVKSVLRRTEEALKANRRLSW